MRRVRVTIVAVEKQYVLHIMSGMQSACAVIYCHLWPVWVHRIFTHYLINGKIFGKTFLNLNYVVRFSIERLPKTLLILRRIQRDLSINVRKSSCKVPVILVKF
jgi:hypothetical protein